MKSLLTSAVQVLAAVLLLVLVAVIYLALADHGVLK